MKCARREGGFKREGGGVPPRESRGGSKKVAKRRAQCLFSVCLSGGKGYPGKLEICKKNMVGRYGRIEAGLKTTKMDQGRNLGFKLSKRLRDQLKIYGTGTFVPGGSDLIERNWKSTTKSETDKNSNFWSEFVSLPPKNSIRGRQSEGKALKALSEGIEPPGTNLLPACKKGGKCLFDVEKKQFSGGGEIILSMRGGKT